MRTSSAHIAAYEMLDHVTWATGVYGDPCRQCGFSWSISRSEAIDLVLGSPERLSSSLAGSDGTAGRSDLSWNARGYVEHVSDNLRIWAERLAGRALGATGPVTYYDNELLAIARSYLDLPLEGALWSLAKAVEDWKVAVDLASDRGVSIHHPDRGDLSVLDVIMSNAHDVFHHEWDIGRCNDASPTGFSRSWMLDEVGHAGPEHLRRDYAEAFDAKSGTDFEEVVDDLVALGLDGTSTVVDFGAGTGAFAVAVAAVARQVIVVDVSPAMVALMQARVAGLGLGNVRVVRAGLLSYEHDAAPVDFVHSRNTFHQIPDFWKVMALRRIHRVLRPDGVLHLQDLVFSFPLDSAESSIESWMDGASEDPARGWTAPEYATHLRDEFSTFSWIIEEILQQTGFEILDSWFSDSGIYAGYECRRC